MSTLQRHDTNSSVSAGKGMALLQTMFPADPASSNNLETSYLSTSATPATSALLRDRKTLLNKSRSSGDLNRSNVVSSSVAPLPDASSTTNLRKTTSSDASFRLRKTASMGGGEAPPLHRRNTSNGIAEDLGSAPARILHRRTSSNEPTLMRNKSLDEPNIPPSPSRRPPVPFSHAEPSPATPPDLLRRSLRKALDGGAVDESSAHRQQGRIQALGSGGRMPPAGTPTARLARHLTAASNGVSPSSSSRVASPSLPTATFAEGASPAKRFVEGQVPFSTASPAVKRLLNPSSIAGSPSPARRPSSPSSSPLQSKPDPSPKTRRFESPQRRPISRRSTAAEDSPSNSAIPSPSLRTAATIPSNYNNNRIIQLAGGRSRGSPEKPCLTSPLEDSIKTSEKKRRLRNNESRLELTNSFLQRGQNRPLLPSDSPDRPVSAGGGDFQSAFDEHAHPSLMTKSASFPRDSPSRRHVGTSSPAKRPPTDSTTRASPSRRPVCGLRDEDVKSSPSRNTTRHSSSARLRSPLKDATAAATTIVQPSPLQMKELFRKTLVGDFPTPPLTAGGKGGKRRTKDERITSFLESPKELRALALEDGGLLRSEFRRTAWPCLLADASRRVPLTQASSQLNESDGSLDSHQDEPAPAHPHTTQAADHRQIDLDVQRKYEETDLRSRERLRKFLHAFFTYHPELCYFQGFHDLCAMVLGLFDDDLVADFVVFKISTNTLIRDAHRPSMDATFAELKAVYHILECADAELAEKLKHVVGVETYWGISMLTCLFAHDVAHVPSLERLMDACLASGPHFPLYLVASIALLPKTRLYLMNCDKDETSFLGTLRQDAREIGQSEADELVRFAQILERRVPPAKIIENCYKKLGLPLDSFLASRWLVKTSKLWGIPFGQVMYKTRDKPLGE